MSKAQEGQGWAASLAAVAQSISYDDYIRRMAETVARRKWPTMDRLVVAWGHDPDNGYFWFHVEDAAGTWLGNVEFHQGQWFLTEGAGAPW